MTFRDVFSTTPHTSLACTRRGWLQLTTAGLGLTAPAWAQPQTTPDSEHPVIVAQIADMSASEQDISRDFLIGSRAAWQDFNRQTGLRGRPIQHLTLETDGTRASLEKAWKTAVTTPNCVALSGCVSHQAVAGLMELQAHLGNHPSRLPLIAPWLHSNADLGDSVFDIFPDHQEQATHALRSLSSMGVRTIGVVFANAALHTQAHTYIHQVAKELALKIYPMPLGNATGPEAQALRSPKPTIVLFIGGTPELHDFARQLVLKPGSHCYIVALSNVNLQMLAQLRSVPRHASVIATQAVPLVSSGMPIVRAYRKALGQLFDEPPSHQGLAGFIAARFTAEVLASVNGPITRSQVLATLQRRKNVHVGGFSVNYQGLKRTNAIVTQSMLTSDGRIVG